MTGKILQLSTDHPPRWPLCNLWEHRFSVPDLFSFPTPPPPLQGRKTFCASFCTSLIAGSRRAFLWLCLYVAGALSEVHEVQTFAPCKAFLFDMFAFFSLLENYFQFRTTDVKGKTDHSVSLRWNKRFWTFLKRRVFFLIVHPINLWVDFAGLN